MKKLLLTIAIAILLFSGASESFAAIAFVQQASSTSAVLANTIAATVTATTGNTLIAFCSGYGGGTADGVTAADGTNTYTSDASSTGSASQTSGVLRSSNVTGGNLTVTCTFSENKQGRTIFVNEYSGLANSNPVDASSSNNGTGVVVSSGNFTTTNASDLLFGTGVHNGGNGTLVAADGFTIRGNALSGYEPAADYDRIVSSVGTYNATSTGWTVSTIWAGIGIAYKATAVAVTNATNANSLTASSLGSGIFNVTQTSSFYVSKAAACYVL